LDYGKLNMLMKLGREYGHKKIRDVGVSDTEHYICTFLYFHNEVSQDTVANTLMLDKTTVAKALLSLEQKGFIARIQNPANRRKNILTITLAGKGTISDSLSIYDDWLNKICSCFSNQELRQFDLLFDKMLDCALKARDD
jgi:DNA-binding MarR family transcriptional regulator